MVHIKHHLLFTGHLIIYKVDYILTPDRLIIYEVYYIYLQVQFLFQVFGLLNYIYYYKIDSNEKIHLKKLIDKIFNYNISHKILIN